MKRGLLLIVILTSCAPISITENMLLQSPPVIEPNTYTGNIMILPFNYSGTKITTTPISKINFSELDPKYPVKLFNNNIYINALASDDYSFSKRCCISSKERSLKIANAIGASITNRIAKAHIFTNAIFNPDITLEGLSEGKIKENYISKGYYFILMGNIKYFYAAEPSINSVIGGPNESGIAFAHTKFDDLKLINICSGEIIWEGSAEGEKTAIRKYDLGTSLKRRFLENKDSAWVDLDKLQLKTLNEAINNLVLKLSKIKLPPPEKLGCKQ